MKDFDTNAKPGNEEDEEMMVELDLDDGSHVVCAVITILECRKKDYIVLLPLDEMVAEAFDEYLDNEEFDELMDES